MDLIEYHTQVSDYEIMLLPRGFYMRDMFPALACIISAKSHGVPIEIKRYSQCVDYRKWDVVYTIPKGDRHISLDVD